MRTSNFAKGRRVTGFFRLCLGVVLSLSLILGWMALIPVPVQATGIAPAGPVSYNLPVCIPWQQQFTIAPSCPPGGIIFYWLVGVGIPGWVNVDMNTGLLTVCPDAASAGTSLTFQVWCTEMNAFPFCIGFASADVTLNFLPNPPPCVTIINPTFYPLAWEYIPFSMTLSAVGGVGPFGWSAVGLPVGLSVTDTTNGIVSGIPEPGTCGIYTVTATVSDNGTCPSCCLPVSRDFVLIVDCWANYVALISASTGCDFNVAIGPGLTEGQTTVLINGSPGATLAGGGSQTFTSYPCQSNVVMVDQTLPGPDPNTRFKVIGLNYKVVNDIDNYAYFDYARQVLIETGSNPAGVAQPSGTGFYTVGGYFSGTAPSPVESGIQKGEKYLFREWRLPDGSTNPNRDLVFTVSSAGKAIAEYNTYYLLTIISDYPSVSESSWELKDSTAAYSLALQDVPIPNAWGIFGGVMRPVNASGTHVMTGPATVKIQWTYDYTVPIVIMIVIVLFIVGLVVLLVLVLGRSRFQVLQ
ncbi:MAG: Ig domain-containing protein [Chloroflexi bacterium]|nr:Ig domain-containing protein [Chloroflexota bacterium]